MKKQRKGFTIVELVIVIAVIAILAAVLIPTFAGVIKRANLSADKQAVREMNQALAEWEASTAYSKPANVDVIMQVLGEAGYNTDNWVCLTEGYEVYWYENDNRMVLYNTTTHAVEYPTEYPASIFTDNRSSFHIYNENHIKALEIDFSLGNSTAKAGESTGISVSSSLSAEQWSKISSSAAENTTEQAVITSAVGAITTLANNTSSNLKDALGITNPEQVYVHGATSNSQQFGSVVATMECLSVSGSDKASDIILRSTGEGLKPNVIFLSLQKTGEGTISSSEVAAAQKNLGQSLHDVFVNINENKLDESVSIIIDANALSEGEQVVLDCSVNGGVWEPVKKFTGYFGSSDPEKPIVISNATLDSRCGYAQTTFFDGSESKYFVTGFFGTVYGKATIENIIFRDITIAEPALNYSLSAREVGTPLVSNTRNTVGIIGGIVDARADKRLTDAEAAELGLPAQGTTDAVDFKKSGGIIVVKGTEYTGVKNSSTQNQEFEISGVKYIANALKVINGGQDSYNYVWYIPSGTHAAVPMNVIIRNVVVQNTVTVKGAGCVGGLVGYIGSSSTAGSNGIKNGSTVLITNCTVSANVESTDARSSASYGTVGGILGFMCRSGASEVTIDSCTFNGTLSGFQQIGVATGLNQKGKLIFTGINDFSGATVCDTAVYTSAIALGVTDTVFVINGTIKYNADLPLETLYNISNGDTTLPISAGTNGTLQPISK